MTNGKAILSAGGHSYEMLLTLGALAEIEDGLDIDNIAQIPNRVSNFRASDLAIIAAALLRGGGHDMSPADVLRLPCDLSALVEAINYALKVIPE